tara:strand:- start:811 stop:1608 length:798 start_codon:yes stop_codon:yes gene_type:complete
MLLFELSSKFLSIINTFFAIDCSLKINYFFNMSDFDDLDLRGKLAGTAFAHFQALTTTLLSPDILKDEINKKKFLLYMYGALDFFAQDNNFMQYELDTDDKIESFLSFKVGVLRHLYIASIMDGNFMITNSDEEIRGIFFSMTLTVMPESQFDIVLKGGNGALSFMRNPSSAMKLALDLKKLISSSSDNENFYEPPSQDTQSSMSSLDDYEAFKERKDESEDLSEEDWSKTPSDSTQDDWYDIKHSEQYKNEQKKIYKEDDDLPF